MHQQVGRHYVTHSLLLLRVRVIRAESNLADLRAEFIQGKQNKLTYQQSH